MCPKLSELIEGIIIECLCDEDDDGTLWGMDTTVNDEVHQCSRRIVRELVPLVRNHILNEIIDNQRSRQCSFKPFTQQGECCGQPMTRVGSRLICEKCGTDVVFGDD